MTKTELEAASARLNEKVTALGLSLHNREQINIETVPDSFDQVQLMGERDLAILNLARDTQMVRQIRRAQASIADGTYGTCLECEEEISKKRLNAVPWALLCIRCQEQDDLRPIDDLSDLALGPVRASAQN